MKKIMIKPVLFLAVLAGLLTGCVQDDDTALTEIRVPFFGEEFETPSTVLSIEGWTNFAEEGSIKWSTRTFDGDGYAQFNSFGSGDEVNIGWLVSPAIDISESPNPKFTFHSCQNFVSDDKNKLEVFVSTDYNGTDVLAATWTKINAIVPNKTSIGYEFINGGALDLKPFLEAGTVHIAFKVTGSGKNTAYDGLFQVDGLYVYTPN